MQLLLSVSRDGDPAAPREFCLDGSSGATDVVAAIGRDDGNDIVLDDATKYVSRRHARILLRDARHVYADIGMNPSLVNERPLGRGREHALADGDCIAIGDFTLQVRMRATSLPTLDVAACAKPPLPIISFPPTEPSGEAPDRLASAAILGLGTPLALESGDDPLGLQAFGFAPAPVEDRDGYANLQRPELQPMPALHAAAPEAASAIPADYDPLAALAVPLPMPAPAAIAPRPAGQSAAPRVDPVLEALLRGLGLPQLACERPAVELAEQIGAMLRVATAGTMQALRARALAKKESHIEMTMIAAGANNPMKFFPDPQSALKQMLLHKSGAYMNPVQAFGNAFGDLRAHELAMVAGVRAALTSMLGRFAPEVVEARVAAAPGRWLRASRKARCWDDFVRLHRDLAEGAGEEFQRLFSESFAPAYEQQMERIREHDV